LDAYQLATSFSNLGLGRSPPPPSSAAGAAGTTAEAGGAAVTRGSCGEAALDLRGLLLERLSTAAAAAALPASERVRAARALDAMGAEGLAAAPLARLLAPLAAEGGVMLGSLAPGGLRDLVSLLSRCTGDENDSSTSSSSSSSSGGGGSDGSGSGCGSSSGEGEAARAALAALLGRTLHDASLRAGLGQLGTPHIVAIARAASDALAGLPIAGGGDGGACGAAAAGFFAVAAGRLAGARPGEVTGGELARCARALRRLQWRAAAACGGAAAEGAAAERVAAAAAVAGELLNQIGRLQQVSGGWGGSSILGSPSMLDSPSDRGGSGRSSGGGWSPSPGGGAAAEGDY
jgi:hypothetical protein